MGIDRRLLLPAAVGLSGTAALAALYFGIVSWAESPQHAVALFWEDRWIGIPALVLIPRRGRRRSMTLTPAPEVPGLPEPPSLASFSAPRCSPPVARRPPPRKSHRARRRELPLPLQLPQDRRRSPASLARAR